jgi:hypothetical protein
MTVATHGHSTSMPASTPTIAVTEYSDCCANIQLSGTVSLSDMSEMGGAGISALPITL